MAHWRRPSRGNPCLATKEDEYEGLQDMFGDEGGARPGAKDGGAGSFGTLFKGRTLMSLPLLGSTTPEWDTASGRRKADARPVVVKVMWAPSLGWEGGAG